MLFVSGVALTVVGCGSYWYLLPRGGRVHPLVERWDGGQLVTIGIMSVITCGIALVIDGIFG